MAEALVAYGAAQYPDRPLWRQAFAAGRRAQTLAPDRLEPLRFLAEAYSRSNWHGPAWATWLEYLRRGGPDVIDADGEAQRLVAAVGHELGYGAYARQDFDLALDFFLTIIDLVPTDVDAHVWAARILTETERPAQAIAYWRRVAELDPSDRRAAYFLDLTEQQALWGTRAVNAFREGVAHYEAGRLAEAEERFARAALLNPAFPEPWAWHGRVRFERGDYQQAGGLYARALALVPGNETYAYFRAESERRLANERRE
jgi:tetratricopeptide (TPR) repeat protein